MQTTRGRYFPVIYFGTQSSLCSTCSDNVYWNVKQFLYIICVCVCSGSSISHVMFVFQYSFNSSSCMGYGNIVLWINVVCIYILLFTGSIFKTVCVSIFIIESLQDTINFVDITASHIILYNIHQYTFHFNILKCQQCIYLYIIHFSISQAFDNAKICGTLYQYLFLIFLIYVFVCHVIIMAGLFPCSFSTLDIFFKRCVYYYSVMCYAMFASGRIGRE